MRNPDERPIPQQSSDTAPENEHIMGAGDRGRNTVDVLRAADTAATDSDPMKGEGERARNTVERLDRRRSTTWISHVAYGTVMGALYGPLARRVPLPSVVKGTAFGLAVWAVSYLGGLPAMGMPEAAADQPMQRNALMIGAHAVWGSVMGLVLHLTER